MWTQLIVEAPRASHVVAADFWAQITGATSVIGPAESTLTAPTGSPYITVRATDRLRRSVSLRLGVPNRDDVTTHALDLGAQQGSDGTLRSPGEFRFEVDELIGTPQRPVPTTTAGGISRVDQICIDLPPAIFDAEVEFWQQLTGWEIRTGLLSEFAWLSCPGSVPVRLTFQRLGAGHRGRRARGHIDIACGPDVDALIHEHTSLGATAGQRGRVWHTMTDPTGLTYCLTERDPITGTIAPSPR